MIDFINSEERLLKTQLSILNDKKQKEVFSKIDNHLNTLKSILPEKLTATIKGSELLSSDGTIKLPLKVRGRILGVGRHKIRYYLEEDLKKSIREVRLSFKVDHRKDEVFATIGVVERIFWSDAEKAVRYEGHINDETQARNIIDGVVRQVSATVFARQEFDDNLGIIAKDIEYGEISLVEDGAYEGNTLEYAI